MPTKHPRLNVILEPRSYHAIERLAKKEGISMSLTARDLICEALEIHEDVFWAKEADKREKSLKGRKLLTHKQVWG